MDTFHCQVFPKHYSWLLIIRIVPGIGVTVLPACILSFLFVAGTLRFAADRNRDPGRVPGSPRNLSIRPTRSPPPAHWLTASLLPSCLEYYCPFAYPLTFSILLDALSSSLPPLHWYPINSFTISPFSSFYFCHHFLSRFSFTRSL